LNDALKASYHALNLDPNNSQAKMIIAEIMNRQKNYQRSIILWENVLVDLPGDKKAMMALVELYEKTGQYEKANVKFNLLIAMVNGNLKQLFLQKNSYEQCYWIEEVRIKPVMKRLISRMNKDFQ
jgi:tetratricopeptide (TPR) repeat protein